MKLKHLKYLIQEELEKIKEMKIDMGGQFPGKDIGMRPTGSPTGGGIPGGMPLGGTRLVQHVERGGFDAEPRLMWILDWLCANGDNPGSSWHWGAVGSPCK